MGSTMRPSFPTFIPSLQSRAQPRPSRYYLASSIERHPSFTKTSSFSLQLEHGLHIECTIGLVPIHLATRSIPRQWAFHSHVSHRRAGPSFRPAAESGSTPQTGKRPDSRAQHRTSHGPLHDMLAFQFPPHHLRTRSPPHSSYSALVTATRCSSSVCANAAIPRQASIDGSAARTMRSGISGGRIGRSVACRRSARPGICAGEPVRKTFCVGVVSAVSWGERERSTNLDETPAVGLGE